MITRCEFERDDALNLMLFPKINKTNSKLCDIAFPEWYVREIMEILSPCFELMVNAVLRDRPNLV